MDSDREPLVNSDDRDEEIRHLEEHLIDIEHDTPGCNTGKHCSTHVTTHSYPALSSETDRIDRPFEANIDYTSNELRVPELDSAYHLASAEKSNDNRCHLALPEGKDKHLFVSYSSEDSSRVWPIVDAIEKRFNLQCIYADRDFQPGMDITENIRVSMNRSWKVLLMLSPNFTESGWCKYEREFAFVQSIENRMNCIIPVLLEECQLPPTLKTVTYIDATQEFCDVPEKVVQAIIKPDIAETMMAFDSIKRYENGFCVDITARRDELWRCRPAKYRFKLEQQHILAIRDSQIKIPVALIEEAIFILNQSRAVLHYDFSVSRAKLLCWSLFLIPVIALFVYGSFVYDKVDSGRQGDYNTLAEAITGSCSVILVLVVVPVCIFVIPICCHRQQMYMNVHSKMWHTLHSRCLQMETILLFSASRERPPTLSVMRYKVSECLDYLTHLTLSKSIRNSESQAKKYAWSLIEEHLQTTTPAMILEYDKLPDASYNRHNVRLGKACICQCVEQKLGNMEV